MGTAKDGAPGLKFGAPGARRQSEAQTGPATLVVDDHPIVAMGLKALLGAHDSQFCSTSSFVTAFRICRHARPRIVIVDLAMQGSGLAGLAFIRRLRNTIPEIPILVLSMHSDPLIVREALKEGANGYITKDASTDEIVDGLKALAEDTPYVSQAVAGNLAFFGAQDKEVGLIDQLSSRERLILSLLAEGKSYKQIADKLAITYKSVAHTCNRLKPKLGVSSLPELVRWAVQHIPIASPFLRRPGNRS